MRHIRIVILCLGSMLLLSSCALFRTATTRTARSLEVENQIVQLPTVVDLVVDSELVRTDTTWVVKPFKGNSNKQMMHQLLIGKLQEQYHADVIVEPKMIYSVQGSVFSQTMSMSVTGYPARYKHFRTASEEDLRLLDRPWDKTVNHNTILINTDGDGRRRDIRTEGTAPITRPKTSKKRMDKVLYDRGKYIGSVDAGFSLLFPATDMLAPGFVISTDHVWKVSKHEYLGFGLGYQMGFCDEWDMYSNIRRMLIPITFESRTYMTTTKVAPYLDIRLGLAGDIEKRTDNYYYGNSDQESYGGIGGIVGIRLGLACGKHFHFNLGTEQYVTNISYTPTFSVNVGCSF